jgi:hypothetical protein
MAVRPKVASIPFIRINVHLEFETRVYSHEHLLEGETAGTTDLESDIIPLLHSIVIGIHWPHVDVS